jgi:hypothetical protein
MRRQGQRSRTIDPGKPDSLSGQSIKIGSLSLLIAIAAQMIGPGGVKGDEQDIQNKRIRQLDPFPPGADDKKIKE